MILEKVGEMLEVGNADVLEKRMVVTSRSINEGGFDSRRSNK